MPLRFARVLVPCSATDLDQSHAYIISSLSISHTHSLLLTRTLTRYTALPFGQSLSSKEYLQSKTRLPNTCDQQRTIEPLNSHDHLHLPYPNFCLPELARNGKSNASVIHLQSLRLETVAGA